MIFVKTFTPADFLNLRNLPEKVRNLRHFVAKIIKVFPFLFTELKLYPNLYLYNPSLHFILGLITKNPDKILNRMWNFTKVKIILH